MCLLVSPFPWPLPPFHISCLNSLLPLFFALHKISGLHVPHPLTSMVLSSLCFYTENSAWAFCMRLGYIILVSQTVSAIPVWEPSFFISDSPATPVRTWPELILFQFVEGSINIWVIPQIWVFIWLFFALPPPSLLLPPKKTFHCKIPPKIPIPWWYDSKA